MEVLDNIARLLGDDLKQTLKPGAKLRIAAGCFSIYAFEALRDELKQVDALEFIFTDPAFAPAAATDRVAKSHREYHIPKEDRERAFYGTEFEVQLKNKLTQKAVARECADWIRQKASFRSNRSGAPMQAYATVANDDQQATVYTPLEGFTAADLGYQPDNATSKFVNKFDDPAQARHYVDLFDQVWNDPQRLEDVTERICDHIATVYRENAPERIYFLMLFNIFSEFLEDLNEDLLPNDKIGYRDTAVWKKLYNFQADAAAGIINKLETYNGCILADSVGLGKTFTALAVIKYYELRNKSVLVLCPKKLAENWTVYRGNLKTNLLHEDRLNYDVLCHTDLQRTTGDSLGMPLNQVNWSNYDLVVIDESHNFRNNDVYKDKETRYQRLMDQVIREGVQTKVLMLSATPVNNRFNDLKNQLALAYEGESETLSAKLKSGRDIDLIFRRAQAVFNDWSKRPPAERTAENILAALDFDFFELLDSVTIARSRKHIERFYDTTEIGSFPQRMPPTAVHCPLTHRTDVISIKEIYAGLTQLSLAVYAPVSYLHPSRVAKYEALYDTQVAGEGGTFRQADREKALQALMTTNLLKRLESSVEAFRLTLGKLCANHHATLKKISDFESGRGAGKVTDLASGYDADTDFEGESFGPDITTGGKVQIDLDDLDLDRWAVDLKADLAVAQGLLDEVEKIGPDDDAKLLDLKTRIQSKLASPLNAGNRKILLFTAFADTAEYLYRNLAPGLQSEADLHTAVVTGSAAPRSTLTTHGDTGRTKGYDFQSLLTLFSPRSKSKDAVLPHEPGEIDLLIGTDCISEGQNLQDCDTLINYDIHWNPVRIIQRFGRIDRIGSTNERIQLVNYWPDVTLDEYINLKERVENRMVIADMAATADDNVLQAEQLAQSIADNPEASYRRDQLERLQSEVVELEELKTGVGITDLGLNDFRMDLVNYTQQHPELGGLPGGMHAVVRADPERGLHPGVIFTLKNRHPDVGQRAGAAGAEPALAHGKGHHHLLHPFYMVYVGEDGAVLVDHSRVKHLLDLVRLAARGQGEPDAAACAAFNRRTDDGRQMEACSTLLDHAIASIIDVKADGDLDSLFTGTQTTALRDRVQGLDDFELLSFLVVEGGGEAPQG